MAKHETLKKWGKSALFLLKALLIGVIFAFSLEYFGSKGFYGLLILFVGMGLWRLFKYRQQYIIILRQIESMIFGRPLDKQFWSGNDWQNKPKVKFVWKKKKKN